MDCGSERGKMKGEWGGWVLENGKNRLLTTLHASNTIMPTRETDTTLEFHIEIDREEDGRWIAEIPDLPGVLAYGDTKQEAIAGAEALALRVIADRIEEEKSAHLSIKFATA
jgi:predicted RNase H-like HicB family nuclease